MNFLDARATESANASLNRVEGDFRFIEHAPQAMFLIREDLSLIKANVRGAAAIEKRWVGLEGARIHFNCPKNTDLVCWIIRSFDRRKPASRSVILHCVDLVPRAYTLTYNPDAFNTDLAAFVLTVSEDLDCSDQKMDALIQAFSLTISEARILQWMVQGYKPKEIAFKESLSTNTVRSHLRTLYAKMNVRSYNDALILAVRLLC